MCSDPEGWIEEKVFNELTEKVSSIGGICEVAGEVKDTGEEVMGTVLRGHLLQEISKKLHCIALHQLRQETGRSPSQLKYQGEHFHTTRNKINIPLQLHAQRRTEHCRPFSILPQTVVHLGGVL